MNASPDLKVFPVNWKTIDDIVDMEPIGAKDAEVLDAIRSVILEHGYEDRFGVCLIHKHFDVAEGEALLETTDELNRVSTIQVVRAEDAASAMETAWKFERNDPIRAGRKCTVKCAGFGQTGHSRNHECFAS